MKSANERHSSWPLIVGIVLSVLALTAGPALAALTFSGTSITGDSNSVIDATGTISIGASAATGITIGRSGITATFPGTVTITGTTTSLQNLVVSGACTGCGVGNFTAGGDLSGSSTSQTVIGLQEHPISTTTPSPNQVLTWNGTFWTPANVSSTGGIGITAINGLSNATTSIVGAGTVTVSTSSPNTITITGTGSGAITIDNLTTSTFQIQGAANQITVATSPPNIISLSLPQNIGTTSLPTFGGLVVNGNATTTGALVVLGPLLDASGNKYVTSTAASGATTTINGIPGPAFTLTSSTYLGITNVAGNFTFTNLGVTSTGGNWTGTWQNATSGTYYPYSNPLGFITTSTPFTTTTINGISGPSFTLAPTTYLGIATSGTTLTFTNLGVTTTAGNWAGTWQGTNSSTWQPALGYIPINASTSATSTWLLTSNGTHWLAAAPPSGGSSAISTTSAITSYNFPFWANTTGGLSGTSTLFFSPSTGNLIAGSTTDNGALFQVDGNQIITVSGTFTPSNLAGNYVYAGTYNLNPAHFERWEVIAMRE